MCQAGESLVDHQESPLVESVFRVAAGFCEATICAIILLGPMACDR